MSFLFAHIISRPSLSLCPPWPLWGGDAWVGTLGEYLCTQKMSQKRLGEFMGLHYLVMDLQNTLDFKSLISSMYSFHHLKMKPII
jgi:hypothetical protein